MLRNKIHKHQHGAVFLALLLVMFVAGSTVVIGALNNRQAATVARAQEVRYQMDQAKASLLAYAASYNQFFDDARGPGFFPCPDTDAPDQDSDGTPNYLSAWACTTDSIAPAIGRLPQMEALEETTFRFNAAYAAIDEQFWYVISPRFLYSSNAEDNRSYHRTHATASEVTDGWLSIDGSNEYVALIIAPGEELESQDRSSGPDSPANYLDGQNADGDFDFFTSYASNPAAFNDQILGITHDEYMLYVTSVVAREMAPRLDAYYESLLPYQLFFAPRYPGNSGPMTTSPPYSTCSTSTFSNLFDATTWLRDDVSGNGEQWACKEGTYWVRDQLAKGYLSFDGCPSIRFRIEYSGVVEREGDACVESP